MSLRILAVALAVGLVADAMVLKGTKPMTLEKKGLKEQVIEQDPAALGAKNVVEERISVKVNTEDGELELESHEGVNPARTKAEAVEGKPVVQRLKSDEGMAYYGEIEIGGQIQQGIYDTGSFDLVVLSSCTAKQNPVDKKNQPQCCALKHCPKAHYSSVLSGNYQADTNQELDKITYGSGPVIVRKGHDAVSFKDHTSELTITDTDVPIKVIVEHQIDLFKETDLQAIVGIGPGKFEERENRMTSHMGIGRFLVCFQADMMKDGYITWNDKDRSADKDFKVVPVMGKLFWATPSTGYKLMGSSGPWSKKGGLKVGCEPSCGAIIDTGTSLLTPPADFIKHIDKALNKGHIKDCSDMSKFPTLHFKFGDVELSLPPETYIGQVAGDEKVGFKHHALAFPLLPMRSKNHTLNVLQKVDGMNQDNFAREGACALMLSEGDASDGTPWGPMVIFGMGMFRKYAVQFDLSGDKAGTKPSLSNPTRVMRFTEASADCQHDSGKTMLRKLVRTIQGGPLQKVNLNKIRKSSLGRHLEAHRALHATTKTKRVFQV